ncbi:MULTISPECIES: hypothetical protein [Streptomyces]|uniref:ArsR family transcriptional regulator n=1 Tax=Streptomyces sudanensis TaxID=436397 RepID=A0ABY4T7U6_9ACTN|nr:MULTISPECIES: hypothetical protein [Streptomyces]URN15049.1 hypothetical protein MW084_02850 [Streptomyces sudanensis]
MLGDGRRHVDRLRGLDLLPLPDRGGGAVALTEHGQRLLDDRHFTVSAHSAKPLDDPDYPGPDAA